MNAKQRQILGISACILFVVLGTVVWLRVDAARKDSPLTYTQEEPGNASQTGSDPTGHSGSAVSGDSGNGSTPGTESGNGERIGTEDNTPDKSGNGDPGTDTGSGAKTPSGGLTGDASGRNGDAQGNPGGSAEQTVTPGGSGGQNGGPASPDPQNHAPSGGENELAPETTGNAGLSEAQSLFAPVSSDDANGTQADDLIAYLKSGGESPARDESAGSAALIGYAAGDCYEIKTVDGAVLANLYYYFPTGAKNRRGDVTYDEAAELPRMLSALRYLFPEHESDVCTDFVTMRHWNETYRTATGSDDVPWSGYVRSRYYGTRYCRMAVSYNSLIVTVYPQGYSDELGDFASDGTYREFYTYPAF